MINGYIVASVEAMIPIFRVINMDRRNQENKDR